MRISDWSSDVCSSDLFVDTVRQPLGQCKTAHEILKIRWRRHHHRIGQPVEFERDRNFGHPFAHDMPAASIAVYFVSLEHFHHIAVIASEAKQSRALCIHFWIASWLCPSQ